MKIIAIIGSMRKGNSYQMVEGIVDAITEKGVELEVIHLKDISMSFCDGCLSCDETGKCHMEDDVSDIVTKIENADGLIFASPTRWSLLSGEMKTFMDRLNPLAVPEKLANKKAIIFVAGQTKKEDDDSIMIAASSIESFCINAGIDVVDKVLAYDCLMEKEVNDQTLLMCKNAAINLVTHL